MTTILEDGNGLFSTHVALDDVNFAIKNEMRTESELSKDSLLEIIGDGNGFSSCVILVTCDWSIPSIDLPKKLVLKIVSFAHIKRLIDNAKSKGFCKVKSKDEEKMAEHFLISILAMHNQEINFYEILSSANAENILTPKVYFSQKFDETNRCKGFIGMEFLEGIGIRHSYENCTVQEFQPILKSIASIQALSFSVPNEDFKRIEDESVYAKSVEAMMSGEGMKGCFEHTRLRDTEQFTDIVERIQGYGTKILDFKKAFNLNKVLGKYYQKRLRSRGPLEANILWTKESNGQFTALKVIDYQTAHTGNPAEDLVRFLTSTLSGSDRQAHWEQILETFYEYFLEALGENKAPYSSEELKKSYKLFFPMGGLALLPLFGAAVDMKLESMDKDETEKYKNIVIEKLKCLLEDVEKFYLESSV
ncbi:hypothetical protein L5515_006613 [Caenorhabditis briggsae]|uniref:CHK kinase-like domain-containing protein n=1 Tax=Caenorhabditis briggsae TaxID=6238 RepID=A0AAE9JID0_CAEBR|nr:hypothetical protein L5515_006613 [Caenorhabditis briggsae]